MEPASLHKIIRRKFSWLLPIVGLLMLVGCQTDNAAPNPWTTESYRDPSEYRQVPHSTYAPMPTILPSVDGTTTETIVPGAEDELEQVLQELNIN